MGLLCHFQIPQAPSRCRSLWWVLAQVLLRSLRFLPLFFRRYIDERKLGNAGIGALGQTSQVSLPTCAGTKRYAHVDGCDCGQGGQKKELVAATTVWECCYCPHQVPAAVDGARDDTAGAAMRVHTRYCPFRPAPPNWGRSRGRFNTKPGRIPRDDDLFCALCFRPFRWTRPFSGDAPGDVSGGANIAGIAGIAGGEASVYFCS